MHINYIQTIKKLIDPLANHKILSLKQKKYIPTIAIRCIRLIAISVFAYLI